MLKIIENVDIQNLCTFKVGGTFRYFSEIDTVEALQEAYIYAEEKKVPIFILGGGSNIVFTDGSHECLALKIKIPGFEILEETNKYTDINVGAGMIWDLFVERAVSMGLSGIEALSAIPGTVGATPVQNVGAYGQEVKDTIREVFVFDIANKNNKKLSNAECAFAYRDSIFKNEARGKYIITAVVFRLLKKIPTVPNYPGVKKYFADKNIEYPTLLEVREAIIEIRRNKLPNPKEISNVGSFFKNPIVLTEIALKLKEEYPSVTLFPIDKTHTKIPAGWLIEQSELKGKEFGPISIYEHNALVLVNNGQATFEDVMNAKNEIIERVFKKFEVRLEMEPEVV
jgi:UDP-N-acetylmuramate dehydrogenase